MKIGNTELRHGIFLAPMAGFSDRAMRRVCHEMGAEYSVTEMISAKAVTFGDKKTFSLARIRDDEGPVALQIFGSEPDVMGRAAEILTNRDWGDGNVAPSAIDINMGCPVHKIFSNGEGSALMRDPNLIYRIVKSVKENTDLPVTVKHRTGVSADKINAVECALAAEAGGAELITVHGRTRVQMYSGDVDRKTIKKVKMSVHIPVIANGDIISASDAISMLSETGADGIAIGRGAVGNPFIFGEIISALDGKKYTPPTLDERVEVALWQLRLSIEDKGEGVAVPEARKQIASYLHSFRGAAKIRAEINRALTYVEIEKIFFEALRNENS
ncbi:MAG: tRNA dihydrouridine synthase DusB [Clostridia bacterium]|nr:tRNA dihydrouridine synthase DusB [Clostridia bacterium]